MDVPVNTGRRGVILARYLDADGFEWRHCAGPHGSVGGSGAQLPPSGTPGGSHRQPRAVAKDDVVHRWTTVVDVPVIMQLEFQQSFETVEVSQIQFLHRLPDIPVATQRQVLIVQTVQETGDSSAQRVAADIPVNCRDKFQQFTLQTLQKTVDFPQVQFSTVVNVPALMQEVRQIQSTTRS